MIFLGDLGSDSGLGADAEVAVQRSIDKLWRVPSRAYHLRMDVIYNRYKDEIVDPWIRSLKEEGERSLIGTIELSSKVAKGLVTSALEREDNRYKRAPVDMDTINRLIATYGNLVAAEEALRELFIRLEGMQARSGL